MSDKQEQPRMNVATNNNTNNNRTSTNIIRYSKEMLLSLYDSPLVDMPENMPPLSLWFGEEAGTPAAIKNTLNSSIASLSADKSIILGPPKTNFASSLNGGLKRTTDMPKPSRPRQLEDSMRTHNTRNDINNSNRMSRGTTHMNESGSHHYSHHHHHQNKNGLERRSSNPTGNQSTYNKRYHNPDHQHNDRKTMNSLSGGGRRDHNNDQRSGNRQYQSSHNDMGDRGHNRVPEWVDYDPDIKAAGTDDNQKTYANDLEAWKASMKKKEGLDDTNTKQLLPISQDEVSTQDTSDPIEKILDLGTLDLQFISTPTDNIAQPSLFGPPSSDSPVQRGSRFAKFFAKREEATHSPSPTMPPSSLPITANSTDDSTQSKSISVNDLFQMPGNHSASPDQQHTATPTPTTESNPIDYNSNMYHGMMSEVDVLKRLGARTPEQSTNDSNSIGFNKVLEILSQPKPTVPKTLSSSSPDVSGEPSPKIGKTLCQEKKMERDGKTMEIGSSMPSLSNTQQPLNHSNTETKLLSKSHSQQTSTPTETVPTAKPKKSNNLFAGSLPTSVLRQMSARSEGRSPSLSSNKSGHSGGFSTTSSQNGSPSSIHLVPHQNYQHPQAQQSPSYHSYSHHSTHTQRFDNAVHDPSSSPVISMGNNMMNVNTSRNLTNAYDMIPQYGNGHPPPNRMPPPFMPMDRSFVPPHIMPGAHPMMSPPFPMHPQNTGPPPFMSMPPLGMPQQMYNNMNHGWNHH